MFNITELNLYSFENENVQKIKFDHDVNFIYSKNSTGKTKMIELLDYLLGSSSIKLDPETFYGIKVAELVTNKCIIRREISSEICYFKLREKDEFEKVTLEIYNDKLGNLLFEGKNNDLSIIREICEQNITFRTFSVFNFLNQTYQGVIDRNVFTKQNFFEYFKAKYILKYMFNKKNYEEIFVLKKKVDEDKKLLEKNSALREQLNFLNNACQKCFIDLGIKYKSSIDSNLYELDKRLNNEVVTPSVVDSDYYTLLSMMNNIDNQLQHYEDMKKQGSSSIEKNNKRKILLESLSSLAKESEYGYIIEPIKNQISKMELLNDVISFNDYSDVISDLKKKRNSIVKKIEIINSNSNAEKDFIEKRGIMLQAKEYLKLLSQIKVSDDKEILDRIKNNREEIRKLESNIDEKMEDKISEHINKYYKFFKDKNYKFIDDDYKDDGFALKYNSKKNSVLGYVNVTVDDKKIPVVRMIGSMARQTLIQVCTYLAFLEVINSDFEFPKLGTVFFDCVSKSFDDDNKKMVYLLLKEFCRNNPEFNVVVTTDTVSDSPVRQTIEGLNPLYRAKRV